MSPPEIENGQIPYKLYNLGGVIFNLITSGICLALFLFFFNSRWLSPYLLIAASIGLSFAFLNGFPMRLTVCNDGNGLITLNKSTEAVRCFFIQLKVSSQITSGLRLKDMPAEWFKVPSDNELKSSICATIGVLSCDRAIDQLNFQLAYEIAKRMTETDTAVSEIERYFLTSELIFCELVGKNRSDVLNGYRNQDFKIFLNRMKNFPSLIRMQYTYELMANQDAVTAKAILMQFEKIAKSFPYKGEITKERELIEYAKNCYRKKNQINDSYLKLNI